MRQIGGAWDIIAVQLNRRIGLDYFQLVFRLPSDNSATKSMRMYVCFSCGGAGLRYLYAGSFAYNVYDPTAY